jgi:hypothetical protein
MPRKRSDLEVEVRRADIEQALLDNDWSPRRRSELMARWDIGRVQLWRDRRVVMTQWNEISRSSGIGRDKKRDEQLTFILARIRYAVGQSFNRNDYRTCLRLICEEAKLLGAYPADK